MTDIASHRGGALLWPENSRISFENTTKLAVEQVEFDVHPTRDGKLVVIHDDTLDRTTDGKGPVAAQDWAALSKLVLKGTGGQRMLLLDEVIEIFRPTPIVMRLEIKCGPDRVPYPGHAARVARALEQARVLERCVLTSFQLGTVCEAVAAARPMKHVWLVLPQVADRYRPRERDRLGAGSGCADARPAPEYAHRGDRRDCARRRPRHRRLGLQRRRSDREAFGAAGRRLHYRPPRPCDRATRGADASLKLPSPVSGEVAPSYGDGGGRRRGRSLRFHHDLHLAGNLTGAFPLRRGLPRHLPRRRGTENLHMAVPKLDLVVSRSSPRWCFRPSGRAHFAHSCRSVDVPVRSELCADGTSALPQE